MGLLRFGQRISSKMAVSLRGAAMPHATERFFSWKFDTHPPPCNANNVEQYTFPVEIRHSNETVEWPECRRQ